MCRNVVQRRLSAYDEKFDDEMVKSKESCDEIFCCIFRLILMNVFLFCKTPCLKNYFGYKRSRED